MSAVSAGFSRSDAIKWAASIIVPVLVYFFLPLAEGMNEKIPLFLAITLWAVMSWALETMPSAVSAIIMVFLYSVFVTKPGVVFSSFGTFLPWIAFAGLIIADVLHRTGAAKRIAIKIMLWTGSSYACAMLGFLLAGFVLSSIMPASQGRLIIFTALGMGMVDALGVDPKSRMSSSIIMAGLFATAATSPAFMTSMLLQLVGANAAAVARGQDPVNYGPWMYHQAFGCVVYAAIAYGLIFLIRGKERLRDRGQMRQMLTERLAAMGSVSRDEVKGLGVLIVAMTGFLLAPMLKLDGGFVFALLAMVYFLPGVNLMTAADLRRLDMPFVIFLTACISIGIVAQNVGIDKELAGILLPLLEGQGETMTLISSYFTGVAVNFILTPMAAMSALCQPMAQLAADLGVSPQAMLYTFSYGLDQYIFPYEIGFFLYIFMTGYITLRHVIPALALRMFIIMPVFIVAVLMPYWKLIDVL